jgi:hypothetical protein
MYVCMYVCMHVWTKGVVVAVCMYVWTKGVAVADEAVEGCSRGESCVCMHICTYIHTNTHI